MCVCIVCFFFLLSVNRAEQTLNVASVVALPPGEVVLVMSTEFNGFHPYCRSRRRRRCAQRTGTMALFRVLFSVECHFVFEEGRGGTARRVACGSNPITSAANRLPACVFPLLQSVCFLVTFFFLFLFFFTN